MPVDETVAPNTWDSFLSNEENRAGLLQFGLSMLGGQSGSLAQDTAQAIGAGAETRDASIIGQNRTALANETRATEQEERILNRADTASKIKSRATRDKATLIRAAKKTSTTASDDKSQRKDWLKFVNDAKDHAGRPTASIEELRTQWEHLTGLAAPGAASGTLPAAAAPSATADAPAPDGTIITNPATGAKLIKQNGQWVAHNG